MKPRYLIRPKADQDLEDRALYLATQDGPDLGHRFLLAAHHTFTLLARHPEIGWQFKMQSRELGPIRVFTISGFTKILVLYRVLEDAVEIVRIVHGSRDLRRLMSSEGFE